MSEKKFPATPRRRQEARKQGQVLKSQELSSAVMLLGLVAVMKFWLPQMLIRLQGIFTYVWGLSYEWTPGSVASLFTSLLWLCFQTLAPVLGAGVLLAAAGNYLQVGTMFNAGLILPRLSRISPIAGAKKMFGLRAWVELVKSLAKTVLIGFFLYQAVKANLEIFPGLQQLPLGQAAVILAKVMLNLAWKISLAFVAIALLDYLYQWWDFEKNLRMTQEELKQEFKQTEGHPELKAAIKKRQKAVSMRRMMQDLKKADVVITNPTHLAVALRYDLKEHSAPYVLAKGQEQIALRLKELAREYGIAVMEDKPLARTLYAQTEIGQMVPAELYQAVAEVLAFVYRLKKKQKSASAR